MKKMKRLTELLKKLETNSVLYEEIKLKDNFVLKYLSCSGRPGLYLYAYRSKNHSFDNRCEEIFIDSRDEKEILKLIDETKARHARYSQFMTSIGFTTRGNGLYLGELIIHGVKKPLTFSFRFGNIKKVKVEYGWYEKPSHYVTPPPHVSAETDDFIGFVAWYLRLHLSLEEQLKLPQEVRDMIMRNEFDVVEQSPETQTETLQTCP